MADVVQWALPQLRSLLPLDDAELLEALTYTNSLPDAEAGDHLQSLVGDSPKAISFVSSYVRRRGLAQDTLTKNTVDGPKNLPLPDSKSIASIKQSGGLGSSSKEVSDGHAKAKSDDGDSLPPTYAATVPPPTGTRAIRSHEHTNQVIDAERVRARDEQYMQQALQNLQYQLNIFNSEIEPEHEADFICSCPVHQYLQMKYNRLPVQEMWAKAVMYPGETFYSDSPSLGTFFGTNPYLTRGYSPYGYWQGSRGYAFQRPIPSSHAAWIHRSIQLNNQLNEESQARVDRYEPKVNIWDEKSYIEDLGNMSLDDERGSKDKESRRISVMNSAGASKEKERSRFSFRNAIGIKTSEQKAVEKGDKLRTAILAEESGRWPNESLRGLVYSYQEKVGMLGKIGQLRATCPLQYLHLLRAGYFEPIPVAWATQASNPMKFSIEAQVGWRGITPKWRGYEDLAEERLYWVLNHREGSTGTRMKPDFISALTMARERMARAVEPPPMYYSVNDTCQSQHTSTGSYSKQVMPAPFHSVDRPELPTDDTMILLDVSGSMDFDPMRPIYNQYLIIGFEKSWQPKNKDVAKAIIRRFTDAMTNHDHSFDGYDLVTFANNGQHIGKIQHKNLDSSWSRIRFGGGTRVMTGWQLVKELHFRKHSQSATHHPIFGWQAGPETPMLRLLLLLDGEATDMDEFELDLLGLNWCTVTVFLIGVDGCPHHHRHANELQRISDVNPHVSFVDAQGNFPERFVTHELLKRHLGYDISMQEFEQMEELPPYIL